MNQHTIFLDCDGVYSDFINAILRVLKYDFEGDITDSWKWGHIMDVFPYLGTDWQTVSQYCTHDFWANLPWTADGKEILEQVQLRFRPDECMVLTRPMNNDESYSGKARWVSRNIPKLTYRLVPTHVPKEEFAHDFNCILIDDCQDNIERFIKAGGAAIMVPLPCNKNDHIYEAGQTVEYIGAQLDKWIDIVDHPARNRKEQHA